MSSNSSSTTQAELNTLYWLPFKEVAEGAECNPSLRLVDKKCNKLFESSLEGFWATLKHEPPSGPLNLKELISTIEADPVNQVEGRKYFTCFRKLQEIFTRETAIIPKNRFPSTTAHYEDLQTQVQRIYEDRALVACWPRIKAKIPVLQHPQLDETSAAEIRAWLNNPANTPALNAIITLNLSRLRLKVFPQEITKLSQLQDLYLDSNQISAIPEGIRALTGLLRLYLNNNQIRAIPDAILALTQLQELYLSNNQISAIPDAIRTLTQLRELGLDNNQINTIPDAIQALTGLQGLYLHNNQIRAIPDAIQALTRLQRFSLSNNQIRAIPDAIQALTGLLRLYLSNNQISAIPDAIRTLTQLRELGLDNNQISTIPGAIQALTGLQDLDLGFNLLKDIPDSILALLQLEHLGLNGNQISSIPNDIRNLIHLKWLYLHDNKIISIPDSIRHLAQLKDLGLDDNQISSVPQGIRNLTHLWCLRLNNNQISFIPGYVLDMTQLKRLCIKGNPIPSLDLDSEVFEDLMGMEKTINYKKELTHPSSSPLAQLYQTIIRGRPENEMWAALHRLTPDDRNWIFERVWRLVDCPLGDPQWGENHAFDNLSHLYLAVRKRMLLQLEEMPEERKNLVYGRVYELAGRPDTQDLEWGRKHALDNLPRLSDAVASSA